MLGSLIFFFLMLSLAIAIWTDPTPPSKPPLNIDQILGLDGRGGGGWD